MPYSFKADLLTEISEDELIQLTDDESAGIVNEARVTAAIAKADGIIDSYCGQVETVPFVPLEGGIPAVIKQHSITIAIYFIYSRRSVAPEIRAQNYKDAIAHLKDISTGKATIGATTTADYEDNIEASRTEEDRTFTTGKKSDGSTGSLDNY
jgi:phage gp36-like protein